MDVKKLRTLCNQNGMSCKDDNGKYLKKHTLIKQLGGTVNGGKIKTLICSHAERDPNFLSLLNDPNTNMSLVGQPFMDNGTWIWYYQTTDPDYKKIKIVFEADWPKPFTIEDSIPYLWTYSKLTKMLATYNMKVVKIETPTGAEIRDFRADHRFLPINSIVYIGLGADKTVLEQPANASVLKKVITAPAMIARTIRTSNVDYYTCQS